MTRRDWFAGLLVSVGAGVLGLRYGSRPDDGPEEGPPPLRVNELRFDFFDIVTFDGIFIKAYEKTKVIETCPTFYDKANVDGYFYDVIIDISKGKLYYPVTADRVRGAEAGRHEVFYSNDWSIRRGDLIAIDNLQYNHSSNDDPEIYDISCKVTHSREYVALYYPNGVTYVESSSPDGRFILGGRRRVVAPVTRVAGPNSTKWSSH